MNLLAIDTTTEMASVALLIEKELTVAEQGSQKTHAQLLLPMIDTLLVQSNVAISQLDGILFGCGPGSFTGLRIACSVAKGLAYAHGLDLIPVSSLATIAWSARQEPGYENAPILAVLDARMHEMYWGYFAPGSFSTEEHVNAVSDMHLPSPEPILIAGVGIDDYWTEFPESIKNQMSNKINLYPNAAAMIQLVQRTGIKPVSIDQAQPIYVRNKVTQGDSRG